MKKINPIIHINLIGMPNPKINLAEMSFEKSKKSFKGKELKEILLLNEDKIEDEKEYALYYSFKMTSGYSTELFYKGTKINLNEIEIITHKPKGLVCNSAYFQVIIFSLED